jgi:hypothetical protein
MMSKKDYIEFAKLFREYYKNDEDIQHDILFSIIHDVENIFSKDNPNFDRQRFEDFIKKED